MEQIFSKQNSKSFLNVMHMSHVWPVFNLKLSNIKFLLSLHTCFAFLGDSSAGDQQLVVTIELNGVLYEGVLFANNSSAPHSPQAQRPRPMVT